MESIAFNQFTNKNVPANSDYIVGYDVITNEEIRIPVSSLAMRGKDGDCVEVQYSNAPDAEEWHFPHLEGDTYMRQRIGTSDWSNAMKIGLSEDDKASMLGDISDNLSERILQAISSDIDGDDSIMRDFVANKLEVKYINPLDFENPDEDFLNQITDNGIYLFEIYPRDENDDPIEENSISVKLEVYKISDSKILQIVTYTGTTREDDNDDDNGGNDCVVFAVRQGIYEPDDNGILELHWRGWTPPYNFNEGEGEGDAAIDNRISLAINEDSDNPIISNYVAEKIQNKLDVTFITGALIADDFFDDKTTTGIFIYSELADGSNDYIGVVKLEVFATETSIMQEVSFFQPDGDNTRMVRIGGYVIDGYDGFGWTNWKYS